MTGREYQTVHHSKEYDAGGWDGGDDHEYEDDIITWHDEEQEWVEAGKMKIPRSYHAATTIRIQDQIMEYCQ